MELDQPIMMIKGVGEKIQKNLEKLKIFTIGDLLEYYPKTYDMYENITLISQIKEGDISIIEASILTVPQVRKVKNLQILSCQVHDSSAGITLTWFNQNFLRQILRLGNRMLFRGKAIRKNGVLVLEQPKILTKEEYVNKIYQLQPMYSLTNGITNHMLAKFIKQVLKELTYETDYLSNKIRSQYQLLEWKEAIKNIHFPKNREALLQARRRLVFDEFFLFQLAIHQLKIQKELKKSCFVIEKREECDVLIKKLPYILTNAQLKTWQEIEMDLTSGFIMNRLVQGDVGSGKTVIATLALLLVIKNGGQGSLMVPTEVLAKQHFDTLSFILAAFEIRILLLVGSMTAKEKRIAYQKIKEHEVDLVVGTHALIQEKVEYANLSLVVTDEQHRFGVKQREALSNKGKDPHILVMSATPIPRTLAIILYGDLDLSVIDELPSNRLPIKNCVVNTNYRTTAYQFIEKEVLKGRQAYIICPMVEESENIEAENVLEYTEKMKESMSSMISIAYLHGKMKPKEKNAIMEQFSNGEIHILVSTTVVEVGVNVPNATIMMVENAERFGLAQLHQLRGRVGRGTEQSYCILVSGKEGKETKERLEILNRSNDGFYIASEDLKLRGPGDLFGIRQSGMIEFKLADIFSDAAILKDANEAAKEFSSDDIKLLCKQYEKLRQKLSLYTNDINL